MFARFPHVHPISWILHGHIRNLPGFQFNSADGPILAKWSTSTTQGACRTLLWNSTPIGFSSHLFSRKISRKTSGKLTVSACIASALEPRSKLNLPEKLENSRKKSFSRFSSSAIAVSEAADERDQTTGRSSLSHKGMLQQLHGCSPL